MSIAVQYACGQRFSAKEKLAGKRVQCPKCEDPLSIPDLQPEPAVSPLSDLFDEEGVGAEDGAPFSDECDQ